MASKRLTKSAVDWAKLAERVPESQKGSFLALKARSDNYLRRALANPEKAPKLDFAQYKVKTGLPAIVDAFQKQYESLQIPFPSENLSPQISEQEKQAASDIAAFIADSNKRIATYEAGIKKWDSVLPYEEMTMEDFKDAHPELALDPINKPTLWPHTPEEQIGYKEPAPGAAH